MSLKWTSTVVLSDLWDPSGSQLQSVPNGRSLSALGGSLAERAELSQRGAAVEPSARARRSARGLRSRRSVKEVSPTARHASGSRVNSRRRRSREQSPRSNKRSIAPASNSRSASSKTRSACWPLALTSFTRRKRRAGVARLGDFHAVVVGSGVGGAVAAARLALAGSRFWSAVDAGGGDRSPGTVPISRPDGCGRPARTLRHRLAGSHAGRSRVPVGAAVR